MQRNCPPRQQTLASYYTNNGGKHKNSGAGISSRATGSNVYERAISQTSADSDEQDGWTVVKGKCSGRKQARRQSEKLAGDNSPQQSETQPVEPLNTTQETPPPSPTSQRRHPSRCQHRKRRRTEQQGAEAMQRQAGSEVESSPADVPALPVTETLPPRQWERADLRTEAAGCNPPGGPPAGPAGGMPVVLPSDQQVTIQAVTYIGSLFVPERVAGKSLSFLVDTGCTHNLLSRMVFDRLLAQTRQQMV